MGLQYSQGCGCWHAIVICVRRYLTTQQKPTALDRYNDPATFQQQKLSTMARKRQTNLQSRQLTLFRNGYYMKKKYEPGHKKPCLMSYANNKGAVQPAHPHSLISAFVVHCLDTDSIAQISRL